jgi:predicted transglutaminase-like cysteine proteinase
VPRPPSVPRWPDRAALCLRRLLAGAALLTAGCPATVQAWDPVQVQHHADSQGPQAAASAQLLTRLLQDLSGRDDEVRLARINEFFNRRIVFREDAQVWGEADHWASPLETLAKGQGDCEDFAIAKYFSLLAAGLPPDSLRLVYVQAQQGSANGPRAAHMVLAYYATPQAEPLILDNLIADVRPASRRPDLLPIFSFNAAGLWQGTGALPAGNPLARLSRWRQVLDKARLEGFL